MSVEPLAGVDLATGATTPPGRCPACLERRISSSAMCGGCWRLVPKSLRDEVARTSRALWDADAAAEGDRAAHRDAILAAWFPFIDAVVEAARAARRSWGEAA